MIQVGEFMFILNPQDKNPIFIQIEKQIVEFIALGVLKEKDQLPSVRLLANTLGINPNTVAKAYSNLEKRGVVYTITGKGVYIAKSEVKEQLKEKKSEEFKQVVAECKKFGIQKESLIAIIENQWEGE